MLHPLLGGETVSAVMPLQPCEQTVPDPHMTTYKNTSKEGWVHSLLLPHLQCQRHILQRQHKTTLNRIRRYLYMCGFTTSLSHFFNFFSVPTEKNATIYAMWAE